VTASLAEEVLPRLDTAPVAFVPIAVCSRSGKAKAIELAQGLEGSKGAAEKLSFHESYNRIVGREKPFHSKFTLPRSARPRRPTLQPYARARFAGSAATFPRLFLQS
jgi:hypothetical protein